MILSLRRALTRLPTTSLGRNAVLILVSAGLMAFGVLPGISILLTNLFYLRLGFGADFIGVVSAIGGVTGALFSLPSGYLSRRFGPQRMMIVAMASVIISQLGITSVEFLPQTMWKPAIYAIRPLYAFAMSTYFINLSPLLAASTTGQSRERAFGLLGAISPLAGMLGAGVGGMLPGFFARLMGTTTEAAAPYRLAIWAGLTVLIPAMLILARTENVTQAPKHSIAKPTSTRAPWGAIVPLMLAAALRKLAEITLMTYGPIYLDSELSMPTAVLGGIGAAAQSLSIPVALATPWLIRKLKPAATHTLASGLFFVGLALAALVPTATGTSIGYVLAGVAISQLLVVFNVTQMNAVGVEWRATMASATQIAYATTFAVINLAAGALIDVLGYPRWFGMGAIGAILCGGVFWLAFSWWNRQPVARRGASSKEEQAH